MKKNIITKEVVEGINELIKQLCFLPRWSSCYYGSEYDELSKQSLNCIVSMLLAKEVEQNGEEIDWKKFPKISIYRSFQKSVYCDIKDSTLTEICKRLGISKAEFNQKTTDQKIKKISEEFFDFLYLEEDCMELQIFRAATKIATYLECVEIQGESRTMDETDETLEEILFSMNQFVEIPGFNRMKLSSSKEFQFFKAVSSLRNRARWTKKAISVPCSVLGHMYDTAVFAYLMGLEAGFEEEDATKAFFMGVIHDVPEKWTGDMHSTLKDAVPGLRKITEILENEALEENVYSKLPEHLSEVIRENFLENEENAGMKALLKRADYMSALSEIDRLILAGSKDPEFPTIVARYKKKISSYPPSFQEVIKNW